MLNRIVVSLSAILLALFSFHVCAQNSDRPSFDCKKARSISERIICADAELSRMDRELADLYRRAKVATDNPQEFLLASQREWQVREESCRDRACLIQWYEKRKLQLSAIAKTLPAAGANGVIASSAVLSERTVAAPPPAPRALQRTQEVAVQQSPAVVHPATAQKSSSTLDASLNQSPVKAPVPAKQAIWDPPTSGTWKCSSRGRLWQTFEFSPNGTYKYVLADIDFRGVGTYRWENETRLIMSDRVTISYEIMTVKDLMPSRRSGWAMVGVGPLTLCHPG